MTDRSPLERARDNVPELTALAVTGFWLVALLTGQEWWLVALLVGYVVVVPLTEILLGEPDDEPADETTDERDEPAASTDAEAEAEAPLDRLRRRYAEGELTDEQFERKLERLLETETLEDVEDATRDEREREFERS
jgi:uncharacterized membrane protein